MNIDEQIDEILTRWFKNPPYQLPYWLTRDFIKGVVLSQRAEVKLSILKAIMEAEPKKSGGADISEYYSGYNEAIRVFESVIKEVLK